MSAGTLDQLLVHRGAMLLLDAIVVADAERLTARIVVRPEQPFVDAGGASNLLIVEYLAQAIAAHQGSLDRAAGKPILEGYLLAVHRMVLRIPRLPLGSVWYADVRRALAMGEGFGRYDAVLRDATAQERVADGELTVFQSPLQSIPGGSP